MGNPSKVVLLAAAVIVVVCALLITAIVAAAYIRSVGQTGDYQRQHDRNCRYEQAQGFHPSDC
jgi:hypothetical protein